MEDFPGRLFPWSAPEEELRQLQNRLTQASEVFAELGSGSGGHILTRAAKTPQAAWVGFELRFKRAFRTLEKAGVGGIENVFVIRTDGRKLENFFPEKSVSGLYINFPDPWTKSGWRKHRMLSTETLDSAAKIIRPGGFVSVKTDHQDYFQDFYRDATAHSQFTLEESSVDFHKSGLDADNILTEFERLFIRQKLPIAYLRMSRK